MSFATKSGQVKLLVFECKAIGMYAKSASAGNKNNNAAAFLCFLNYLAFLCRQPIGLLPYLPWLIAEVVYMGFFRLIQSFDCVRKDNPTPAYSSVSNRRRLTVLVEVHWARRVQAPMPQISEPNSQQHQITESCTAEGNAVSTQEIYERKNEKMEGSTRVSAPWTDCRPHPRIVNHLLGGSKYNVNLWEL
jgi:hypothetical protein